VHTFETISRIFVCFACLQGLGEKTQKLARGITVTLDGVFDRLLKGNQQIVCIKEAATQVAFNLEGILPVHSHNPALHMKEVAGREELLRMSIHAGNTDGKRFTVQGFAYLLELEEIVLIGKDKTKMVGVWRDAGVGLVYR